MRSRGAGARGLAEILWRGSAHGGGGVVTYTIPRYPVHLIDVVQVADGSRVTIRPTLPQDVGAAAGHSSVASRPRAATAAS